MRSGKLDRVITVQSSEYIPDDYGNGEYVWTDLYVLRAQVIQSTTEEYLRAYGETEETAIIFRTRFAEGINTAHRILYDGHEHNIKEIKELGRRRGLEIRTVAV